MMKTLLLLIFITPIFAFGQIDTLNIDSSKSGKSYLSSVLINKKSNIGIFEIHYYTGRLSNSYFYVIDFNKKEIMSKFSFKNWTYLYSSWIDNDSILHLSKGSIFTRKILVDLKNGEILKSDKNKRKQIKDDNNVLFIDSQELYCTNRLVYWNGLKIFYAGNLKCFIIKNE